MADDDDKEDEARAPEPPPPGAHVFGPARDPRLWGAVGISVDEDTLPHILTFTACAYREGVCGHEQHEDGGAAKRWQV